tara:strand:+ start:111 stop:368 length:258 start_codon:yes stop_codon:yes gene_type:complete
MARIEIYTSRLCGFCARAKSLLEQKGLEYEEIDVDGTPGQKELMVNRANGAQTVPQIFINDVHIGGCDDLYGLEAEKQLEALLES